VFLFVISGELRIRNRARAKPPAPKRINKKVAERQRPKPVPLHTICFDGEFYTSEDLVVTTLFGTNRTEVLARISEKGRGHGFWIPEEKKLFRWNFPNFLATNRQPKLKVVRHFLEEYLTPIYPMFSNSFRDVRVLKSVYYCLRNIITKRQHPNSKTDVYSSISDLFGPLAVIKNIALENDDK
jgi:hypothetical protein